jgi:FkbM family methyltransferase
VTIASGMQIGRMAQYTDKATSADVFYAYRLILGREPDSPGLQNYTQLVVDDALSVDELRRTFLRSPELARKEGVTIGPGSPYFHYHCCFNVLEIIRRHAVQGLEPNPDYLTNFLGVLIDPKFFPDLLTGRAGEVEPVPIPENWHADMAEWAAALRAVDLAGENFTMIELGCGWGCWMNNTGRAARNSGRGVHVIGVEGDAVHVAFAKESLATNGFDAAQIELHHGVAGASSGTALFPQENRDGHGWGAQPIFGVTDAERDAAVESGKYDALKMFSVAEVAAPHKRIDLLHADIQGGEADLVAGSLATLKEKVRYLLIGTHSRVLEGRLFDTLLAAGWKLEIERPGLLNLNDARPVMHVDGVQGWRNTALA